MRILPLLPIVCFTISTIINSAFANTLESELYVRLRVNGSIDTVVIPYKNMPLVFTITVSNPQAFNARTHNRTLDLKLKKLRAQLSDSTHHMPGEVEAEREDLRSRKRRITPIRLGNPSESWLDNVSFHVLGPADSGTQLESLIFLLEGTEQNEIVVDGIHKYRAEFTIDPMDIITLLPGDYSVVARVIRDRANGGVVVYESNQVAVRLPDKQSVAVVDTHDSNIDLVCYYLKRKNPDKSLSHAVKALEHEPSSIQAMKLLGRSYEMKDEFQQALQWYTKALDTLLKKEYSKAGHELREPPIALFSAIRNLRAKIKASEGGH